MKTEEEIQYTHDLLTLFLLACQMDNVDKEIKKGVKISIDVLCWILDHEMGERFEKVIKDIREVLNQNINRNVSKN